MEYWGRRDHRIRFDSAEVVYVTAIMRTNTGINKAEDAGRKDAPNRVRRCAPASLSGDGGQISPISCLDPPGDLVRPKFSNI